MLQCCVCLSVVRLSSVTLCIVAKRCVLEQQLLLKAHRQEVVYEKSIGTKMNDLDLCLEVVLSRSRQPLHYIWRWISRKPLETEVWFQKTTDRKWHNYELSNGQVTDDVTWPWKVKLVTPIRLERNISKTTWAIETSNLVCSFVSGMPNGRTNNFPWKWAWPRSRDPYNFWQYGRLS